MLSYPSRRWAIRLALFTVLFPMAGLGAGCARAASANVDVAAFALRPGAETMTTMGKVGDVVTVPVGIYNKGPDKVQWRGFANQAPTWRFKLPPGTETVAGPPGERYSLGVGLGYAGSCSKSVTFGESDYFGAGPYDCLSAASLEAGAASEMVFHLKINKVIPNATGMVTFNRDLESSTGEKSLADSNSDNDEASVIINPDSNVVTVVGGVPVTRTVLGAALLLLLATGGGLVLYRRGGTR